MGFVDKSTSVQITGREVDWFPACFSLCVASGSATSHYSAFADRSLKKRTPKVKLRGLECGAAASDTCKQSKSQPYCRWNPSSTELKALCKEVANATNFHAGQLNGVND